MLETDGQFLGQKLLLEISWQRCKNSGRLRACMLTMALFGGGSTRLGSQGGSSCIPVTTEGEVALGWAWQGT